MGAPRCGPRQQPSQSFSSRPSCYPPRRRARRASITSRWCRQTWTTSSTISRYFSGMILNAAVLFGKRNFIVPWSSQARNQERLQTMSVLWNSRPGEENLQKLTFSRVIRTAALKWHPDLTGALAPRWPSSGCAPRTLGSSRAGWSPWT